MPKRKTHEEYMAEIAVKNNKVTIIGKYVNKTTKVLTKCNICEHEWMANPGDLLGGHGCPNCFKKIRGKTRLLTNEQFLLKLSDANSDIEPLEEYKNSNTPIMFKCKICGHEWNAKPNNVLNGHGCRKCSIKLRSKKQRHSLDDFISLMKEKNPTIKITGRNYVNNKTPIECECLVCGYKTKKRPDSLLVGRGCKKCGFDKLHNLFSLTQEEFESRLADVNHNIEVLGAYYNVSTNIKCRCKTCGYEWITKPINMLYRGSGCLKCSSSKGEKILVDILDSYNITHDEQHTFNGCVYIGLLRFDSFDMDNNIAYEYQGEQHYIPIDFAGKGDEWAEESLEIIQTRDNIKREYCKEHKIPLIEIPYWEKDNMRDFLISKWKELNLDIA